MEMGLDRAGRKTQDGSNFTFRQIHEVAQGYCLSLPPGQAEECLHQRSPEHDLVLTRGVGVCRPSPGLLAVGLPQGLMKGDLEGPPVPVGEISYPLPPGEGDGERLQCGVFRTLGPQHPSSHGHGPGKTRPEPFVVLGLCISCHRKHHANERARVEQKVDTDRNSRASGPWTSSSGLPAQRRPARICCLKKWASATASPAAPSAASPKRLRISL